jgi:hypothetical protein
MHRYRVRLRGEKCGFDLILFATLLLCVASERAPGADAVFSKDGQHIYAACWEPTGGTAHLRHIDLSKQTISLLPLKELSGDLRGVTRSDDQDILCSTATVLWRYHPSDGTFTKVCDLPREPVLRPSSDLNTSTEDWDAAKHRQFKDVAYDSKARAVLLSTEVGNGTEPIKGLWLLREGESKLQLVRISRLDEVECPVFDGNGELFFSNRGDLWHGKVTEDQPSPWLVAYRYVPLATLETDVGLSPGQCGVRSIAVARNFIYVFIKRLRGGGDWQLAQVPRPAPERVKKSVNGFNTHLDLPERLSIYRHVFDSTKVLTETMGQGLCYLCASADESRVYYTFNGRHWLITNGKLQELHFAGEASCD